MLTVSFFQSGIWPLFKHQKSYFIRFIDHYLLLLMLLGLSLRRQYYLPNINICHCPLNVPIRFPSNPSNQAHWFSLAKAEKWKEISMFIFFCFHFHRLEASTNRAKQKKIDFFLCLLTNSTRNHHPKCWMKKMIKWKATQRISRKRFFDGRPHRRIIEREKHKADEIVLLSSCL